MCLDCTRLRSARHISLIALGVSVLVFPASAFANIAMAPGDWVRTPLDTGELLLVLAIGLTVSTLALVAAFALGRMAHNSVASSHAGRDDGVGGGEAS